MKKILVFLCLVGLMLTGVVSVFAFNDMDEEDLYYDSVMFLADEGIVTGYADGSFGYDLTINRAELLTIIVKSIPAEEQPDNVQWLAYSNENCFADVTEGQWYTQYVCFAKDKGWVGGYPDDTFKPSQPVNFVEALKISMSAHKISFETGTSPWYKGLVEAASEWNLIPPSIEAFDQKITRGEMCDLIARILKYKSGELEEWLGDKADCAVTYLDIVNGGQTCSAASDNLYGPLFVDWKDAGASVNGSKISYSNDMFSFEIDNDSTYLEQALGSDDFKDVLIDPADGNYNLDNFSEDQSCAVGNSATFNEAVKKTKYLRAVKVPVFENITLDDASKFTWDMTILVSRNPISWDMNGAKTYNVCAGSDVAPIYILANYNYQALNQGAIVWIDSCPEKGLTSEQVDHCVDLKFGIAGQINPGLIGE
jgi:hypothetical protein